MSGASSRRGFLAALGALVAAPAGVLAAPSSRRLPLAGYRAANLARLHGVAREVEVTLILSDGRVMRVPARNYCAYQQITPASPRWSGTSREAGPIQ